MKDSARLYLFGDQTNDFTSGLSQLLRVRDNPLLLSFLERTHVALRQEITHQSSEIQESLPRFSQLVELVAAFSPDLDSAPILASTLTAIYQLGSFIRYVGSLELRLYAPPVLISSSYYGEGSRPYPSGSNHAVLGICTGLLSGSATASASSVTELLPLAVEAVLTAFRTGLHVTRTRDHLDRSPDRTKSWSYIVPGLQIDPALSQIEEFSNSAASLQNFQIRPGRSRLTLTRTYSSAQGPMLALSVRPASLYAVIRGF